MMSFKEYELKNRLVALNIYHEDEFEGYRLNFETIYKRKYAEWMENMIDDCRVEVIRAINSLETINQIERLVELNHLDSFIDVVQSIMVTMRDREYWKIIMDKLQDKEAFNRFKKRYIDNPYSPPERLFK